MFINRMMRTGSWAGALAIIWGLASPTIAAELIRFASNGHGLTGAAAANVSQGAFTMHLSAGPDGAVLHETDSRGMGVNSNGIPGAVDGDAGGVTGSPDRINLPRDATGVIQPSEFIQFSFNRPGVIQHLLFDGVKDETLEFLRLETPSGVRTFFDAEVVTRLTLQGFGLATLTEPNVTLLVDGNDDLHDVNLPFQAGDVFKLSYGEFPFPPGYVPTENEAGNGARWEGLVVVPEPSAMVLALTVGAAMIAASRRRDH